MPTVTRAELQALEKKVDDGFEISKKEFTALRRELSGVESRLGERMDRLEVQSDRLGERMDRLEVQSDSLGERMDRLEVHMDGLPARVVSEVRADLGNAFAAAAESLQRPTPKPGTILPRD